MIYKERINRQRELERQQEHWNEVHENLLAVQRKSQNANEKTANRLARKSEDKGPKAGAKELSKRLTDAGLEHMKYGAGNVQEAAWNIVQSDPRVMNTFIELHRIKGGQKELEEFFKPDGKFLPQIEFNTVIVGPGHTEEQDGLDFNAHKIIDLNDSNSFPVAVSTYLHEINHLIDMWYASGAGWMRLKMNKRDERSKGVKNVPGFSKEEQTSAAGEWLTATNESIIAKIQDEKKEDDSERVKYLRTEYEAWKANPGELSKEEFLDGIRAKLVTGFTGTDDKYYKGGEEAYEDWGAKKKEGSFDISTSGLEMGYAFQKQAFGFDKEGQADGEWAVGFDKKFLDQYPEFLKDPEIKRKSLSISDPQDADEKEADAVAQKVVNGESAQIQNTGSNVNRKGEGSTETTPEFQSKLENSKGSGQSLDHSTSKEMGSKMGADLSGVKIHTGSEASAMSESINAKAFTHGQDVYFNSSHSPADKNLLAHELVHTVQQKGSVQRKIHRSVKFEIQTENYIWKKKAGTFSYVDRKTGEFGTTEKGYLPAYIVAGPHGEKAKKPGSSEFVEVQSSPVMKEAKEDYTGMVDASLVKGFPINPSIAAQHVIEYKVKNLAKHVLEGTDPDKRDIKKVSKKDYAEEENMLGPVRPEFTAYNPNTYEFIYYDWDDYEKIRMGPFLENDPDAAPKQQDVHRTPTGKFMPGKVKYMVEQLIVRDSVNIAQPAQFIKYYQFKKTVTDADLIGKTVVAGELELVKQVDNAEIMADGTYNKNTFELKYFSSGVSVDDDLNLLQVHLNPNGVFESKHLPLMKVGSQKAPGFNESNQAQYIQTWKVSLASDSDKTAIPCFEPGKTETRVHIQQMSEVNNGDPLLKTKPLYNPDTYEMRYYMDSQFANGMLIDTPTLMEVHYDDGMLMPGHIQFMEKKNVEGIKIEQTKPGTTQKEIKTYDQEQTAMELQAEAHGYIEFETPKWFRNWEELKLRVEDAVKMTQILNAAPPANLTQAEINQMQKIKDAGASTRRTDDTELSHNIRKWPDELKNDAVMKAFGGAELYVEIMDDKWPAFFQTSEGISISQFGDLMKDYDVFGGDYQVINTFVNDYAPRILEAARAASPLSGKDKSLFSNLEGFLELIVAYIIWGQINRASSEKNIFHMMARNEFSDMYNNLLSPDEKSLFLTLIGNPKVATDNPILTPELQTKINDLKSGADIVLNRSTLFYTDTRASVNPTIYRWLVGMTQNDDKLKGTNVSGAIGGKELSTTPGDKDYNKAMIEKRLGYGINADQWVTQAKERFDEAMTRSGDTADDPTTPDTNEASKTSIKLE